MLFFLLSFYLKQDKLLFFQLFRLLVHPPQIQTRNMAIVLAENVAPSLPAPLMAVTTARIRMFVSTVGEVKYPTTVKTSKIPPCYMKKIRATTSRKRTMPLMKRSTK